MAKKTPDKVRHFCLLLYPDNETHKAIIDGLCADNASWILHDKDVNEDTGELKKPHVHAVLSFKNPRTESGVAKSLGLEQRFCQACNNLEKSLQYLIHANDKDKHQYDISNIMGDVGRVRKTLILRRDIDSDIIALFDWIDKNDSANMRTIFRWCVEHDCLYLYRKNNFMIRNYLQN